MTNNLSDQLDEMLNLQEDALLPVETCNTVPDIISDDSNYARDNIKTIINKGLVALDELQYICKASMNEKAYAVFTNLLKTVSDINKDLLEIQKTKKEIEPRKHNDPNINVDKAVVITGSTSEILKMIKENKDI